MAIIWDCDVLYLSATLKENTIKNENYQMLLEFED